MKLTKDILDTIRALEDLTYGLRDVDKDHPDLVWVQERLATEVPRPRRILSQPHVKGRPWTEWDRDRFVELYPYIDYEVLTALFGRTKSSLISTASRLGIRRAKGTDREAFAILVLDDATKVAERFGVSEASIQLYLEH